MSDNTQFDMTDVPRAPALEIAFSSHRATHWKHDEKNNRFVFAWHESAGKDFIPFPAPVSAREALFLLDGWLDILDYGSQPDHDGDNSRSFRIYNEDWGFIGLNPYAFAAIEPAWAMHGK